MLGPLVIAGISLDKKNIRKLSALGVKDSKKLTAKRREELYKRNNFSSGFSLRCKNISKIYRH